MTITCEHCGKPRGARVKGQKFCSECCRVAYWMAQHPRKRKHPKRIRTRERERLYVIIHKGETLEQLRIQALAASHVWALRKCEWQ